MLALRRGGASLLLQVRRAVFVGLFCGEGEPLPLGMVGIAVQALGLAGSTGRPTGL